MQTWTANNCQVQQEEVRQKFEELRQLLDTKEKEILTEITKKNKETIAVLEQKVNQLGKNAKEIESLNGQLGEIIEGAEEVEQLKQQRSGLNKMLESQLEFTPEMLKPEQLITQDFGYRVDVNSQKKILQTMGINSKLCVVR